LACINSITIALLAIVVIIFMFNSLPVNLIVALSGVYKNKIATCQEGCKNTNEVAK